MASRPLGTSSHLGLEPLDAVRDRAALGAWLGRYEWPFHVNRCLLPDRFAALVAEGHYDPPDSLLFWVVAGRRRAGLLHIDGLDDLPGGSPRFDLRLAPSWRGRGVGTLAVRWATELLFLHYPELKRIEAVTRIDNIAMRKVLERCGYVMEGYLRRTWPDDKGLEHDGALYSILRGDWRQGITTPVPHNIWSILNQSERMLLMTPEEDEPLGVRHNRQIDDDIDSLGRRDNRPSPEADEPLGVRHTRQLDDDVDSLGRRDNRPMTDEPLGVRHNRQFDDDADSLGQRDNRPAPSDG